ncbi:MAG: hypothetical protein KGM49_03810 [Sphingomonadales bacterium]|nr:hypothetical protein [Sphingomonadales bacterium]
MNIASPRQTRRDAAPAALALAALALVALAVPHGAEARVRHHKGHAEAANDETTAPKHKAAPKPSERHKKGARPAKDEAPEKAVKGDKSASVGKSAQALPPRKDGHLYAVVIGPGPGWKKGQPLRSGGSDGHYAYWKGLQGQGLIESAGPVGKDTGFILLRARNQREADALIAADPAVKAGKFRAVARPYAQTLGN